MSPITSTAALRASPTDQCGAGWVSATPGVSTRAAAVAQSRWRKSAVATPQAAASATFPGSSSQATMSAPPAISARQVQRPELPSPNTASRLPAKPVTGITRSPQLERGQAGKRKHHRDDPEADDDLRLGPAELLEVMMDRRHPEDPLAGQLVRHHLHDDRDRLEHEQPADHRENDLVLGRDRHRAEH